MLESMETAAVIFAFCATIWLTLGLVLSHLLKKRPARAHGILVAAQIGALLSPILYLVIQQANWGLLPSPEPVSQAPEPGREGPLQKVDAQAPIPSILRDIPQVVAIADGPTEGIAADPVIRTLEIADRTEPVREIPSAIVPQELDSPVASAVTFKSLVLWGWFGVSALTLLRLCLDFLAGYRLARKSRPLSDDSTLRGIATLARKLNLTSAPELALCEEIPSPVLWGWSWPARVLIPTTTRGSLAFRGVYLHELAHLARRDHWSALLGEIVWCLLPWHPLAWWVRRSLEARAEEACDDWVIACGCQANDYAEELVQLAPSTAGALAMAAVAKGSRLKARVGRLLRGALCSPRLGRIWVIGVGLAALVFTGLLSILQPRIVRAGALETESGLASTEQPQASQTSPSGTNTTEIAVMVEGKPAQDARVWVMIGYDDAGEAKFLGPKQSDAKGRTPFPVDAGIVQAAYALDQQGRLAVGSLRYGPKKASDLVLSLGKTRSVEAMVSHLGKPVAGVDLQANGFYFLEGNAPPQVAYPPGFPESVVQSDEKGRVRFSFVPRKWGVTCRIADSRFAWCVVYLSPELPNELDLVEGGSLRYALEGAKETTDLNAIDWVLRQKNQENKESNEKQIVLFNRFSDSHFKKNTLSPKNSITHLAPGEYTLSFSSGAAIPYTFGDPQTVTIQKGKTTSVTVPVKPAALIKGRFVDSETGEGIPRLRFNVQSTHDREENKDFVWGQTDEKGNYQVYVRGNGHYGIVFLGNGLDADRYQPPPYNPKTRSNGIHGEVGPGATVTFADMAMSRAAIARGKILNQTNPASQEPVELFCPVMGSNLPAGMADTSIQEGAFAIKGIPPGVLLSVRIRQGKSVNIPESLTPAQWADTPKFTLSEANGVTFVGTVLNRQGKPLPRAKVKLFWNYPIQGRDSTVSTSKLMETAETDEQGKFRCVGYWPNERFYLTVERDGYRSMGDDYNATKKGEPGETVDFGIFHLTRSSASIQGKLIDLKGNPLRGLTVRAAGQVVRPSEALSDDRGQFQIDRLPEGPGIVIVQGSGFRSTYAPFQTDEKDYTIAVRRLTDPPQSTPVITDAYFAARKKMIRNMLESLWKTRAENGYGRPILESMNQFDAARAREWVSQVPPEEKRQWENTLALALTDDQIFKITKENVEDGIAIVSRSVGRSGRNPSWELSALGEKFLKESPKENKGNKENKEIAIRLAEEAALSARRINPNDPTEIAMCLAEAGELAWRAGNQPGGRKLMDEALQFLKKDPRQQRFEVNCGVVASCLAIMDWSEAKKTLDLCSDPVFFNVGLAACLKKLVVVNSQAAIKKLDLFKEDRSLTKALLTIDLARTIAPQDIAGALALVKSVEGQALYVQGLVEIALKIHPTDPRTAHSFIDQAVDYLDHQSIFATWSGGGRPVLAAQIVYFAKKMSYPDPHSLIAKSLSYLGDPRIDGLEGQKQQGLLTAFALAFSEPVTAKKLAEMYSSLEALTRDWSQGGRRGGRFLLAMIDPERAMAAFETLAASGWNSQKLSQAGLTELLGSFTKPGDLMENMTLWEHLMWQSLERY